ncbi:MAG: DUF4082 domain-containing protein [Kiritimatiellae bacterium]|nr:DUF4082 domain-containing protein [Kiritimatiellia bacterium]
MNTRNATALIVSFQLLHAATLAGAAADTSIVPADRRTVWNPGIPGGVPPDDANPVTFPRGVGPASVHATLSPSGTDDRASIQSALDAAGAVATKAARRIVRLNAGTFNLSGDLGIPSYVILRGTTGADNEPVTILRQTSDSGSLVSIWGAGGSGSWGAIRNVPGTANKGAATITVDDASTISVGDIITIDHLRDGSRNGPADGVAVYDPPNPGDWVWNNSSLWYQRQPYSTGNGTGFLFPDSDGWRVISQHCEVLAKTNNTLTIYDAVTGRGSPLHTLYYLSPQVYRCAGSYPDVRRYAGLENVRLEPRGTNGQRVIAVNGAAFCWIKGIEVDGAAQTWAGRHCQFYSQTYRCEIRDSYFHESGNYWQGGNAYGLNISGSEHLIENNIVMKLNKPIVLECSNGGNVVAYNYVDEAVIQSLTHDWQEAAISTHASFCHHELFEGNHTPNMGPDSTHGNNGWITMFRNWATGRNSSGYATAYNRAVFSDGWQREMSCIGNVLWRPGATVDYLLLTPSLPSPGINPVFGGPTIVYLLGSNAWDPPDDGGYADNWDNGQAASLFHRHLDFDYKSNAQYDNPDNPVKTLPDSLYRESKPGFFGAYDWPWVDPAGATHEDRVKVLPAKARYDAGTPFAAAPDPDPILPPERTTVWDPGLNAVGGIPHRTTVYTTLDAADYGNGEQNATAGIQAAIDACPEGQVVQLSAGTYKVAGTIVVHKSITLRGAGPGQTLLRAPDGVSVCPILFMGASRYPALAGSTDLTADARKGTNSVTVASTAGLSVGQIVLLDKLTDDAITQWSDDSTMDVRGWFCRTDRPVAQMMEIAGISGHTVRFTTPFHIAFDMAHDAQLARFATPALKYAGVEDLKAYGGSGGDDGGNFMVNMAAYCWLKNVDAEASSGAGVHMYHCFRCVLRDSYIHESRDPNPGGAGYGIDLSVASADCLVENNISWLFNKVMLMRASGGGNVIAYNYMEDGIIGYQLNWMESGLNASHFTTPHYELFEGNQGFNFDGESRWGNSIYITVFRNHLTSIRRDVAELGITEEGFRRAVFMAQGHWWYSFLGNVLGYEGMSPEPFASQFVYENTDGPGVPMWAFYGKDWGPPDPKVLDTIIRHGNYDYATGSQKWEPDIAARDLPDSLYLTSKPAFFGDRVWPWVRPEGSSKLYSLPARERFDAMFAGPPDTTPPSVSLTAPADGATVSNTVTVSATASDNVGVVGVQFRLDGANLGAEDTSAPYSIAWNTFGAANGSHTLSALARDAAGNTATAAVVNVTVANGPAVEETIWSDVTATASAADANAWELGTVFSPTVDGNVIALRAYGVTGEAGDHSARLWRNGDGALLAGPHTFAYSGAGWHRFELPAPLAVTAGESYTVSVSTGTDSGRLYGYRPSDLTSAGDNGMHLAYPVSAGVYSASAGARPTSSWESANYLRDVVFVAGGPDTDADGIPDDADPDDDDDGMSDEDEQIAGTDPKDKGSCFRVDGLAIASATGELTLSFLSVTGRVYDVLWKEDLTTTNAWQVWDVEMTGTGSRLEVQDSGAGAAPQRFYRLEVRLE